MKSKSQMITLAILYAIMLIFVYRMINNPGQQQKPKNTNVSALVARAEREVRNEQYKDAVNVYQQITRDFPDSSEAVEAQFRIAELNENPDQLNNKHNALNIYRSIARQYPDKIVELDGKKAVADQEARNRADRLIADIDRANSHHILYKILDLLVAATGKIPWLSYTLAILILTLFIKVITTPLTKKQYKSMIDMQRLQPKLKELQEKYKDKPEELNKRMLTFYRENGVNPLSGCLPLLIQMPVLYGLYFTIRLYEFQFAKGTFLWIKDLSQPDIPLLILYAVSMFFSTKLTSMPATDPQQQAQQKMMAYMMPVMFTWIVWSFPSAFVLYWFAFNVASTWQTWHIMKHARAEMAASSDTESGSNGKKDTTEIKPAGGQRVKGRRRPSRSR